MAYRKKRSTRSYGRSSYSKSYRPARRRKQAGRSAGQTIRLVMQGAPAPAAPRSPFGSFMPSAMFGPMAAAMFGQLQAQGGPMQAVPGPAGQAGYMMPGMVPYGARMVVDDTHPEVQEQEGIPDAPPSAAPGRRRAQPASEE
jgi:hypothetical protein